MRPLRISLEPAELFLSLVEQKVDVEEVLAHPAYKVVFSHAKKYGSGLTAEDVTDALSGNSSKFFGLKHLRQNLTELRRLMRVVERQQEAWLQAATSALTEVVDASYLDNVWVYPIIGYDTGIGHNGAACMNLNSPKYLSDHKEFLYFVMHEVFHVVYERIHRIPDLADVNTPDEWVGFVDLFFQNEGYATYVPLEPRVLAGDMRDRDYAVLNNPKRVESCISKYFEVRDAMMGEQLSREQRMHLGFGPLRLTYRVGAELARRIESVYGKDEVRSAIKKSGTEFWESYSHLLKS